MTVPGASLTESRHVATATLIIAMIGSFISPFMGSSINIALPSIAKELSMTAPILSWCSTSFLLATAIFLVPLGRLSDIWGRKRCYFFGVLIVFFSSFIALFASTTEIFMFARIVQGIGSAMMYSTSSAMLVSAFPQSERGRVLGFNAMAVYLGLTMGPFLGGILTEQFGWRGIFWFNIFFTLPIPFLIFWKLKGEWAPAKGESFDWTGSILYGVSLFLIIYGLSLIPAWIGIALTLCGLTIGFLFIKQELKNHAPLLEIRLFKTNSVLAFSSLATFLNYSATFAMGLLLSLFFQYILGLSPQTTGLILISQPIMMTLLSPFTGALSDRIRPGLIASIGMAITCLGIIPLIFLTKNTSLECILICLVVVGIGLAFFASPNINAIMSSVDKRHYGVTSSIVGTMRLFGHMISMAIVTTLFGLYLGNNPISPENHLLLLESMRIAFIIFCVFCIFGVYASLKRDKQRTTV
jgi:EmrB/QacA subfamily drug resistance transporter